MTEKLQNQRAQLIAYAQMKLTAEDWHGVADAAMDLREIDAKLAVLRDPQTWRAEPVTIGQRYGATDVTIYRNAREPIQGAGPGYIPDLDTDTKHIHGFIYNLAKDRMVCYCGASTPVTDRAMFPKQSHEHNYAVYNKDYDAFQCACGELREHASQKP